MGKTNFSSCRKCAEIRRCLAIGAMAFVLLLFRSAIMSNHAVSCQNHAFSCRIMPFQVVVSCRCHHRLWPNQGLPKHDSTLERESSHTYTTFIVGELILQLHTHQLHNFNCRGTNLCNACVSLVSACLFSSTILEKGNYTTIMLGELISNYAHITYTTIIVGELIV